LLSEWLLFRSGDAGSLSRRRCWGRALTLAVDQNLGTAIVLDRRNQEVFAISGSIPPYPIAMVIQVVMAEVHGPVRRRVAAMFLLALLQLILLSILLRRPLSR